jgi:flagellar basal body rod protein FlgG
MKTKAIILSFILGSLAACGLIDQMPPPTAPVGVLVAPAGFAFVVSDANGRCYLTAALDLASTPNGELCDQNGMILKPRTTMMNEARFLRIDSDGHVHVRPEGEETYVVIGQLQVARAPTPVPTTPLNPADLNMVTPDQKGVGPLNPQMFAITRQGEKIRFVPMQYGQ